MDQHPSAAVADGVIRLTNEMANSDPPLTSNDVVSICFTLALRSMLVVLEREPCAHNREMFRATLEQMLLRCADEVVKH